MLTNSSHAVTSAVRPGVAAGHTACVSSSRLLRGIRQPAAAAAASSTSSSPTERRADYNSRPFSRAFQFEEKVSIRFSLPNRFFRFDSIGQSDKFAACTLILYSNDGEFGEGPGGVFLRCGSFCAISVSIRQ